MGQVYRKLRLGLVKDLIHAMIQNLLLGATQLDCQDACAAAPGCL